LYLVFRKLATDKFRNKYRPWKTKYRNSFAIWVYKNWHRWNRELDTRAVGKEKDLWNRTLLAMKKKKTARRVYKD